MIWRFRRGVEGWGDYGEAIELGEDALELLEARDGVCCGKWWQMRHRGRSWEGTAIGPGKMEMSFNDVTRIVEAVLDGFEEVKGSCWTC